MYMRNGNCWFFLGPELQIQFKGKKKKKKQWIKVLVRLKVIMTCFNPSLICVLHC